jgi:hypothetical protein
MLRMSSKSLHLFSRRQALAGFAAAVAYGGARSNGAIAQPIPNRGRAPEEGAGPIFAHGGPDAKLYGADEGYPVPGFPRAQLTGNPWDPKYRVGAFSHLDEIYTTRKVSRAAVPWMFKRATSEICYRFQGSQSSLADYLSRNSVTGLVIAKDDRILFEQYQYDRTDRDRLVAQSMVKSITGMLIGIAISEGAIKSVDDTAEAYVPGFKGSEYGRTPIRDLLHMSSGVDFGEARDGERDLKRLWRDMVAGSWIFGKGTVNSTCNSIDGSPRPGRDTPMPASNPMSSAWCCVTPSANRLPTICRRRFGSRSARKPTPHGSWTQKGLNWVISALAR